MPEQQPQTEKSPLCTNLEAFERDLQQIADKYKNKLPVNARFLEVLVRQTHNEPCQPADGCMIMAAATALAETITGYVVEI